MPEIAGVDLCEPLGGGRLEEIWRAIDRWAVLVFHDQRLTDRQLHDFAARFGEFGILLPPLSASTITEAETIPAR